jgi:hypothetical protein
MKSPLSIVQGCKSLDFYGPIVYIPSITSLGISTLGCMCFCLCF